MCKVGVYVGVACAAWSQDAGEIRDVEISFKGLRSKRSNPGHPHEVISKWTNG